MDWNMARVPNLDGAFWYRHPLGVNCNVYAFKCGDGSIDLVDTGIIRARPVLAHVLRNMARDGIDFRRVRNIFHSHGHFDHCQADRWFIEHSMHDIRVHVPEPDAWRLLPGNGTRQRNYFAGEVGRYMHGDINAKLASGGFRSVDWQFRLIMSKFISIPPLPEDTIVRLKHGETISIGDHTARVITTGGHSDGHSFFHVQRLDLLVIGDNDAVNELTCNYRDIIVSAAIIKNLDPAIMLGGHNAIRTTRPAVRLASEGWFKKFHRFIRMFTKAAKVFENKIPLSFFLTKVLGYAGGIAWARFWAFQTLFVIAKFLHDEGLGIMVQESGDIFLDVNTGRMDSWVENIDTWLENATNRCLQGKRP